MPDVAPSVNKSNDKYLLIVAFIQGGNFPRRPHTKFVIEAKFDGELLSTDPVDHTEVIEINQELAWEIDRKSLQLHKLQRSCIKANCFALNETSGARESIGYVVLDVRSAPEDIKIKKEIPLLQPKYQKQKPTLQCMIYTELAAKPDPIVASNDLRPSSSLSQRISGSEEEDEIVASAAAADSKLRTQFNQDKGYFQIVKGKNTPQQQQLHQHTFKLTITIAFARNLVKLIARPPSADQADAASSSSSQFFFAYKLFGNQVTTKPFGDIVSSQINSESTSARLHSSLADLKRFLVQQSPLEILFCSESKIVGKTYLDWNTLLEPLKDSNIDSSPVTVDQILKLDGSDESGGRAASPLDPNTAPVIGLQCILERSSDTKMTSSSSSSMIMVGGGGGGESTNQGKTAMRNQTSSSEVPAMGQNDSTTITIETSKQGMGNNRETVMSVRAGSARDRDENLLKCLTEEMQLKAAYELQIWREEREKEFEAQLKKKEAKICQALADAFKQQDIEREIMIQKKIKEYSDLELLLKNSLSEVEKREKQLAFNEAQISRLKADLHHDYETKLIELREASKRVQEKAEHQLTLQKSKIDSLEEEISKHKRQVLEWEKRYADKETEFARYKERENNRPEIKLQAEINMLKIEKLELERKLDAQTRAKNHYKEQFTKTLEELALLKKREEANARALLKKQQMELDHLRMRYLAGDEVTGKKTNSQHIDEMQQPVNHHEETDQQAKLFNYNLDSVEPALRQKINRLVEERECLMRTGAYSNTDTLIVELDRRIQECLREARLIK